MGLLFSFLNELVSSTDIFHTIECFLEPRDRKGAAPMLTAKGFPALWQTSEQRLSSGVLLTHGLALAAKVVLKIKRY